MVEDQLHNEEQAGLAISRVIVSGFISGLEDEPVHPENQAGLEEWMQQNPEARDVMQELQDPVRLADEYNSYAGIHASTGQYLQKLKEEITAVPEKIGRWRYALVGIAASLLIGISTIWLVKYKSLPSSPPVAAVQDIAPGTNKAVLTLGNGSSVVLDSTHSGMILQQGQTRVVNRAGGLLAYQDGGVPGVATLYNTVSTGRGGQYRLVLSDGTKVWLDAASSLRYPTDFSGSSREVVLTGQGYFEVAHHREPFIVHTGGVDVQDLGTAFNINSYADEPAVQTTLLEGAVKVLSGGQSCLLAPGQQASLSNDQKLRVRDAVNTEAVVAWKNETFDFNKAELPAIMRQLSRWYDVDISYEGPVPAGHFSAYISRNLPVSKVLKLMEETEEVKFVIEGKRIIVKE